MGKFNIRNDETIQSILKASCEHGELLILVTPYLRFETLFLRMDADAVHVLANMGAEDAMYGLRSPDLRMRFPHSFSFVEGGTKLLGLGSVGGRRSLRLRIPATLEEDDQRSSYRVERVGRVQVTFSTRKYALIAGSLVNISTTGARICSSREFEDGEIELGESIPITVPLNDEIRINTRGKIRYVQGRSLGLEFRPQVEGVQLERLARWVFQRQEEDRDRATSSHESEPNQATAVGVPHWGGLMLVSSSPDLEAQLKETLTDLPALKRVLPTVQALKEILPSMPALLFFQVPGTGLDERKRLKAMTEFLGGRWPFLLLGTGGVESSQLFELGSDLGAAGVYALGPRPSPFFKRLVQGILRRHYEGGEGVLAPKEPDDPPSL